MGNQQTSDGYTFQDSDSGYAGLNSPFEFDKSSSFNYMNVVETSKTETLLLTSSPLIKSEKVNFSQDDTYLQQRRNSLNRSKSVGMPISQSYKETNIFKLKLDRNYDIINDDENTDEINNNNKSIANDACCDVCCTRRDSLKSNMSIVSNSWSPNSNIASYFNKEKENTNKQSSSTTTTPTKNYSYPLSFLSGMNFVGRVARGVKDFYNEINPATLTGAIDVVVVQQEDDSFRCSPFHVRFGKLGVIRSKEKIVDIEINGQKVDDLHMVLGEAGEAFFVEKYICDEEQTSSTSSSCESFSNCDAVNSGMNNINNNVNTSVSASEISSYVVAAAIPAASLTKKNSSECLLHLPQKSNESLVLELPSPAIIINESSPQPRDADEEDEDENQPKITETVKVSGGAVFFSDGELTPELTSPAVSRPPTPKSDTELDVHKTKRQAANAELTSNQWSWNWGQLPERQNNNTKIKHDTDNNNNDKLVISSMQVAPTLQPPTPSKFMGGMFNKKDSSGIYLDETDKLDSEVAALYLNQKSNSSVLNKQKHISFNVKDDDQESGNGQSLPQSPSVNTGSYMSILGDVQISLCGGFISSQQLSPSVQVETNDIVPLPAQSLISSSSNLLTLATTTTSPQPPVALPVLSVSPSNSDKSVSSSLSTPISINTSLPSNFEELFQQYAVSYETFVDELSTITQNPNLVVKVNGRFMSWASAAPLILSAVVFNRTVPNDSLNKLNFPRMQQLKQEDQKQVQQQQQAVDKKPPPATSTGGGWGKNLFQWGKKSNTATTVKQQANTLNKTPAEQQPHSKTTDEEFALIFNADPITTNTSADLVIDEKKSSSVISVSGVKEEASVESSNYYQRPFNKNESENDQHLHHHHHYHHHHHHHHQRDSNLSNSLASDVSGSKQSELNPKEKYRKTTRLSSDMIKKLNLQPGSNEIQYSVTTALQGTTRIVSYIFLWNYDDQVIVSDIDGTITKSDVWGQVLPIFGRDWSQAGVADLFTAIERNQYKFMYLSARAIGQSKITRDLLRNINQDGLTLPEGPLLVTPTSLFTAFQKEVIEKKPEEFKISCLNDIQSLFPREYNPLYAGYGNKPTDVTAYKTVGIPVSRIFTINPQGEVKHEVSRTFQSSYSKLCDYVDLIFPPFKANAPTIRSEYDSFNYWRDSNALVQVEFIEKELIKEATVSATTAFINAKETKDGSSSLKKSKSQTSAINVPSSQQLTTTSAVSSTSTSPINVNTNANSLATSKSQSPIGSIVQSA